MMLSASSVRLSQISREALAEGVRLTSLSEGDDTDGPKWVQVAAENQYLGYGGGQAPFEFTRDHFTQMVNNVHAHPSFKRDEAGVACENVIPWDFNHASEADPTSGSLPELGAPARAWTRDLEIRTGSNGKSELWALTHFLEPAREYVKTGQYQWSSIAATFNATDPVTGSEQGALITSIAFTNTPFIEGMEKLVAARGASQARLTGSAEVLDNPPGMNQRIDAGVKIENPGTTLATSTTRNYEMDLLKILAGKLGTRDNEDAVRGEVEALVSMREGLVKCTGSDNGVGVRVLLEVVEKALLQGGAASEQLGALVTALGVKDPEGAAGKIIDLVQQSAALEIAMPALAELREAKIASDLDAASADVAQTIAARKLGPEMTAALMLFRTEKPVEFAAMFPKVEAPSAPVAQPVISQTLTRPLVATPGGAQLSVGNNGTQVMLGGSPVVQSPQVAQADAVNLDNYVGAGNPTQRAMAHLRAVRPDFVNLTHDQQFTAAVQLKKLPNVTFSQVSL